MKEYSDTEKEFIIEVLIDLEERLDRYVGKLSVIEPAWNGYYYRPIEELGSTIQINIEQGGYFDKDYINVCTKLLLSAPEEWDNFLRNKLKKREELRLELEKEAKEKYDRALEINEIELYNKLKEKYGK